MFVRWTVLVPMKALPQAKSRLLAASTDSDQHVQLVRAMRADTLAAIDAADRVARLLVVTDRADDEHPGALVQSRPGLNAALSEGAAYARARWPGDGVAALVGDLPALRGADLDAALGEASRYARSFAADATGTGSTLLTALPGTALRPLFGASSAARHAASAARRLTASPGLRCDVDTPADLQRAAEVGLGVQTNALQHQRAQADQPARC